MDDDIDNIEGSELVSEDKKWDEYENKLKKLCYFIEGRIKSYGHRPPLYPSLLNELNIILFYIETIELDGHFKTKVKEDLAYYSSRALIEDNPRIIDILKGYNVRISENIFTTFYSSNEENPGQYRVDSIGNHYYFGYAKNALEFLNAVRTDYPDFELYDPRKDIINISNCEHLRVDKKNPQRYRCNLLKGPCVLSHRGKRQECPNLEDLIKKTVKKKDFFQDIINGRYKVIEKS